MSAFNNKNDCRKSLASACGFLLALTASVCFILDGCNSSHQSQSKNQNQNQVEQQGFDTPEQAITAAISALRTSDKPALKSIFGPEADEVLSSGDEVADQNRIGKFLRLYDEKHELQKKNEDVILVVGKDAWPMPVPIVKDDSGKWYFDTDAGKEEMLNRRIGQNELDVIQVCEAIVDAQQDYAHMDPMGTGIPEYAAKFISDDGKKNGLYWPTKEGETPSPLGPLVADAVEQGYKASPTDAPRPYHGYYYRMLKSQGPNAKGGALDYVINGRMIGGFGAIAYPADYGNSGIMSFIVNYEGVVYQKDLGAETEKIAKEVQSFDPGEGWKALPSDDNPVAKAAGNP